MRRKIIFTLSGAAIVLLLVLSSIQLHQKPNSCPRTPTAIMEMMRLADVTEAYIIREPLIEAPHLVNGVQLDIVKQIMSNPIKVTFNYEIDNKFDYIITYTSASSLQFIRQRRGYYNSDQHILVLPAETVWWPWSLNKKKRQCYQNVALWLGDRLNLINGQ